MRKILALILFCTLVPAAAQLFGQASSLAPSGCVNISADNQVVQNLRVTCAGDSIICTNHSGVIVQNVVVLFSASGSRGDGISFNGCTGFTIKGVNIQYQGAPNSGPMAGDHFCIYIKNASSGTIDNVLTVNCELGIFLQTVTGNIDTTNFQANNMHGGDNFFGTSFACSSSTGAITLSRFYVFNAIPGVNVPIGTPSAYTGDNVNYDGCPNAANVVTNGLIDGNTRFNGGGLVFQAADASNPSFATVSNVDILHYCNDAAGGFNTVNMTFTSVRARDSYVIGSNCFDGNARSSNGDPFESFDFIGSPTTTGTQFVGSEYFNLANGHTGTLTPFNCPTNCGAVFTAAQVNFTAQTPITVKVPY